MNRIAFLIFISILFIIPSCTKPSGPLNGNSVQPNNNLDTLVAMDALVNNHKFHTDSAFGYNIKPITSDSMYYINLLINGSLHKADSIMSFAFTIDHYVGPGTYPINPPFTTAAYYLNNARHFASLGQIVIKSDSNYALIGTFNFNADTISVTNGSFNVLSPY